MGKGKGSMDKLLFIVKPGYVLYELRGVEFSKASKALLNAQKKLACRTIIFMRPRFRHANLNEDDNKKFLSKYY
jgi:ribosomal protein L16/L10AE